MENNQSYTEVNFQNYMSTDEYILWRGKPQPAKAFQKENLMLLPFGLFFFGFAIFWTVTAAMSAPFMAIFGIPFICVGAYLSFGQIIHKRYLHSKTEYAVTNKKLIRIMGERVDMVNADQINNMQIQMHKDGTGTITFLRQEIYYRGGNRHTSYPGGITDFYALENVADPIYVQQKINEMDR